MAVWSSAYIDALPDSAFAAIDARTGKRHLPYKDHNGAIDAAHVKSALSRLDQTDISASAKAAAYKKLVAAAKKVGVDVAGSGSGGKKKAPGSGSKRVATLTRAAATASPALTRAALPCTVRIVDEEKREIELCATSEAIDSYGTIFAYDASKDAFSRWVGNVREMHDKKAVGRRVAVNFDDAGKKVYVRMRISAGANDTWEKVKDGTLQGASIGASNVEWEPQARRVAGGAQRTIDVATRYDLVELSLVDNPSNPDALGVTFVRDGVPSALLLDEVTSAATSSSLGSSSVAAVSAAVSVPAGAGVGVGIIEQAGTLSPQDPAEAIAAAALARGLSIVRAGSSASASAPALSDGAMAKQRRLAALGAPSYVTRASAAAPGEDEGGYGVEEDYDVDGDHESDEDYDTVQSGPGAGDLVHAPDQHAHATHAHAHTGDYGSGDAHRHAGAHMHMDGTSHAHDHAHDHMHHDHAEDTQPSTAQVAGSQEQDRSAQDRVRAGHTHPHAHVHDHGHYYRVADGAAIDERLVTAEQARTFEYVSAAAFRAARGTPGRGLSLPQLRLAQAFELRALGPYSRNPNGPADAGTPDTAPLDASTSFDGQSAAGAGNAGMAELDTMLSELRRLGAALTSFGQVRPMDRDGKPVAGANTNGHAPSDVSSTGHVDVSAPADGWAPMTVGGTSGGDGRAFMADVTRQMTAEFSRLSDQFGRIEQRLARIEAQPTSGGPVLRAADKSTPLHRTNAAGASDQYRALESLAGRLSDPQAQVAVAAEMIRLQQEAAGLPPAMQVMPRAGRGWGD